MARRAGNSMADVVRSFGEQLGVEIGRVIAESLKKELESSVDVGSLARRLGAGGGRRGRRPAGDKATCSEPGCNNPVLAKGLCRSHYYRARYKSQKAGGKRAAARTSGKKRGRKPAKPAPEAPPAAPEQAPTT